MDETCFYIQQLLYLSDDAHVDNTFAANSNSSSNLFPPRVDTLSTSSIISQQENSTLSTVYSATSGAWTSKYVKEYLYGVVNPLLAACGIFGNLLSLLVLMQRRMQRAMDHSGMERAARLGLIALAVSDILFCISTLPKAFVGSETFFAGRSLRMYVQMYGPCFERIFMRTSTWLTVSMAVSRFAAICHPLKARHLVGPTFTWTAIVITFVVWTCLHLPLFWTYEVVPIVCDGTDGTRQTYYITDRGYFVQHVTLHKAFTYLWSTLGFVVPVLLLAYCNVHLIAALRESRRVRRQYRVHVRVPSPGVKITPTLVAIVCMFIVLVSPSEMLHFYYYSIEGKSVENFNVAIVATNVLVTMNFGVNFFLYCIVNVQFRNAVRSVCRPCNGGISGDPLVDQKTEATIALYEANHIRIYKRPSGHITNESSL